MEKRTSRVNSEHPAEKLEKEIREETKTKSTPRDARKESIGETEEERGRREAESTPVPPDSKDDDITMDEVLGEPFTKKGRVADHFGDFGEEMRKQGKSEKQSRATWLVQTDHRRKPEKVQTNRTVLAHLPAPRRVKTHRPPHVRR